MTNFWSDPYRLLSQKVYSCTCSTAQSFQPYSYSLTAVVITERSETTYRAESTAGWHEQLAVPGVPGVIIKAYIHLLFLYSLVFEL